MKSGIRSILIITISIFQYAITLGQITDDRIVVAQYGEGIFSILERNEMEPSKYLNSFIEINRKNIKKDSSLLAGNIYILPEIEVEEFITPPTAPSPILNPSNIYFGENQYPTLKDSLLGGAVYYLVSGHGGPDPGALGTYKKHQVSEDEYSYDVIIRLAKNLMEHGAEVYMIVNDNDDGIRDEYILDLDKSETTYPGLKMPLNQRARLKQRTESINKLYHKNLSKYQRLIVTHIDSRSEGENIDVFFYHHHRSKSGKKLANEIHQTIKKKYAIHQPRRAYNGTVSSRSNLYVVKNTLPPMVYIELGNIKNPKDQKRFILPENRQALANWIAIGILNDYQNSKN